MTDRDCTLHELKCWPEPFEAMARGLKFFEYRRDDRGFVVGDALLLREWLPERELYSGCELTGLVTYVLRGAHGVPEGYCCMSVALVRDVVVTGRGIV